jgi:hypothetical protein
MDNIDVVLRDEMGLRVPSIPQVTIASGSKITFSVERDTGSASHFAPQTGEILTPEPGARVSLKAGRKLAYRFAAAASGTYGIITQTPEDPAPQTFNFGDPADPPVLVIQLGNGTAYTGPTNPDRTIA